MNNFDLLKERIEVYVANIPRNSTATVYSVLSDLLDYADDLKENGNDGWISVDDRLPPLETVVLVYQRPLRYVLTAEYLGDRYEFSELMPNDTRVTHWQPLPNPPKE
ncbi:DUF551 domain-containing protein [Moraxella bovis]|uniref:DUF551 domain-containing protein n=1 Tax=Moraxella bovis TaxID=476 RepID=UPI0022275007|nr:DUF551 domain-containing protein [Moraxella bovis]UZA19171.1 DUF551 domain-containing protein [Moraxella bovis]